MQRRRELETEVMALKAELNQLRAEQPVHCGECGHELTLVRPGKYQCDWCEGETVVTGLLQENQALRADLAEQAQRVTLLENYDLAYRKQTAALWDAIFPHLQGAERQRLITELPQLLGEIIVERNQLRDVSAENQVLKAEVTRLQGIEQKAIEQREDIQLHWASPIEKVAMKKEIAWLRERLAVIIKMYDDEPDDAVDMEGTAMVMAIMADWALKGVGREGWSK